MEPLLNFLDHMALSKAIDKTKTYQHSISKRLLRYKRKVVIISR